MKNPDKMSERELRNEVKASRALVREQADDEALWFIAEYATEAYLQEALRKLHTVVEGQ